MKYRKKPMVVDAVQITADMFNTREFPAGVVIRRVPWEGQYAQELELKHGPLEVPYVVEPTGPERLSVGDWIVTDEKGDSRRCEDQGFRLLFEPDLSTTEICGVGVCPGCGKLVPPGYYMCSGDGSHKPVGIVA